ncbi:MAG: V-type ATPase subunit [Oscillospiraceae bacterium]
MGNIMTNSALSAKIRAMNGGTIKSADYEALIKLKSVSDVAIYLQTNTRYKASLALINSTQIHRGELEKALKTQLLSDIISFAPFLNTSNRFFIEALELEDGIEKLKLFLSLLLIGTPEKFGEYEFDIKGNKSTVDTKKLAKVKTFAEFMEFIKSTIFYKALISFENDPSRQQLFFLDIALDNFYTEIIFKYAKKYLSGEDYHHAMLAYGTKTDLRNIGYILRSKARFSHTNEQIFTCIIPKYYKIKEATITELVTAENYNMALDIIKSSTPYAAAFDHDDRFIERRTNEYIYRLHKRESMLSPYSIQVALGYIALRRFEIKNIVAIIEGIRYSLTPDEIRKYLIGFSGEEMKT